MAYVFCNHCGHRNPPDSSFCSSCGSALDVKGDRTVTLTAVDPLQDAPGADDDVVVPMSDLPVGVAVLIVRSGAQAGDRFALTDRRDPARPPPRQRDHARRHHRVAAARRRSSGRREGYVVTDDGSLNGTYVNQERIDRAVLHHGDELQVGKFRLVLFERADG